MKLGIAVICVLLFAGFGLSSDPKPDESLAVYRAFLATYTDGDQSALNVGRNTVEFWFFDEKLPSCVKGIQLKAGWQKVLPHPLPAALADGKLIRFVDPEEQNQKIKANDPELALRQGKPVDDAVKSAFSSGLMSFSEVAFDKSGRYAVLQYGFHCGMLCGHGGIQIFEKGPAGWAVSKKTQACGSWQS